MWFASGYVPRADGKANIGIGNLHLVRPDLTLTSDVSNSGRETLRHTTNRFDILLYCDPLLFSEVQKNWLGHMSYYLRKDSCKYDDEYGTFIVENKA